SASEDKFIPVTSLRNRKLTAAQIRGQMNATQSSSSRPISRTTVKRRLRESGLHGQIAARKPLLRRGKKQKRFVWAKKHKEWTLDQWKSVLWSDESKFEIFGSNRRVFVRRRKGERMDSTCLVPTVKHGGGGVMVWGCFAGDTVGDLFKIEGTLNQHGYHSILQRHAIPPGLRLVGRSFIFQQDNDPKHTSRLCKGYLTKKESDGVLRQMTWPPQSPDLNPIEMVWGELDRRVKAKGPTSAKHLWELLQDCWKTISGDYLLKLMERMPRVCKAVIRAKGGYFEETRI
ncbi:transposase, partial [Vibrio parahaemolyticus]|nr:transposase [Vibrio parahaemolyticus]